MGKPSTVRVVMARSVAARWLKSVSRDEYRFVIFGFQNHIKAKRFAYGLRVSRDSNGVISGIPMIPDLGVRERGDVVEVWSSDVDSLRRLAHWAESSGLSTDFIFW